MKKSMRFTAAVVAAAVLIAVLFSAYALSAGFGHACDGDGCLICCMLESCGGFSKLDSAVRAVYTVCAAAIMIYVFGHGMYSYAAETPTPVSLRVKLSD